MHVSYDFCGTQQQAMYKCRTCKQPSNFITDCQGSNHPCNILTQARDTTAHVYNVGKAFKGTRMGRRWRSGRRRRKRKIRWISYNIVSGLKTQQHRAEGGPRSNLLWLLALVSFLHLLQHLLQLGLVEALGAVHLRGGSK